MQILLFTQHHLLLFRGGGMGAQASATMGERFIVLSGRHWFRSEL